MMLSGRQAERAEGMMSPEDQRLKDWVQDQSGVSLDDATVLRLAKVNRSVQRALDKCRDPEVFDTEPALITVVSGSLSATDQ